MRMSANKKKGESASGRPKDVVAPALPAPLWRACANHGTHAIRMKRQCLQGRDGPATHGQDARATLTALLQRAASLTPPSPHVFDTSAYAKKRKARPRHPINIGRRRQTLDRKHLPVSLRMGLGQLLRPVYGPLPRRGLAQAFRPGKP